MDELWNFSDPVASQQRFETALNDATPGQALLLKTQIARAMGLQGRLEEAERVLAEVGHALTGTPAGTQPSEVTVRYHLERGRLLVSATRPADPGDPERSVNARTHYNRAMDLAAQAGLDGLAIDAVHMMAFVDTDPAAQLRWAQRGLSIALQSVQPAVQRWQASLRHNAGYAMYQMGDYESALESFRQAEALRALEGDAERLHVAKWMIAWTLRALERVDEALELQHQLEAERAALGEPDPYVFEELAALYAAKGNKEAASRYLRLAESDGSPE